jgi:ATP-binding cassette subfamily F protein 3
VFRFPAVEPLPSPVMSLAGVSFAYANSPVLLSNIELSVESKSRMAIVGPNGAGKTTLLKLLTGQLEPTQGIARVNPRLRVAYFSQHHVDQLDMSLSPVELFMRKFPGNPEEEQRRLLGAFGISGPLALQRISTLSGGQKSRVVFAMLSAQKPHALVLDEPTNHLDMDSIDALIKACKEYEGAIIAVSHDQRFIGCLCDDSIHVCHQGTVERFREGGIADYIKQLRTVN